MVRRNGAGASSVPFTAVGGDGMTRARQRGEVPSSPRMGVLKSLMRPSSTEAAGSAKVTRLGRSMLSSRFQDGVCVPEPRTEMPSDGCWAISCARTWYVRFETAREQSVARRAGERRAGGIV